MRTNWSMRIDEEAAVDSSDPPATPARRAELIIAETA
jgi:hypothetical protein